MIIYGTLITSAITKANGWKSLMAAFLCSLLSTLPVWILLFFSDMLSPLWAILLTMFPDPCSDFSSSFDPSDHSPPPIAPNPIAAVPDPVSQPPPDAPSSLSPSQGQTSTTATTAAPKPPACGRGKIWDLSPTFYPQVRSFTLISLDPLSIPGPRTIGNTMEYYSAIKKNSSESVLMRWMKLEPIIQSEVSQKDNDHYNILTHIYGI